MATVRVDVADGPLRTWVAEAVAESGAVLTHVAADLVITDKVAPEPGDNRIAPAPPVVRVFGEADGPGAVGGHERGDVVVALPSGHAALVRLLRWAAAAPPAGRAIVLVVVGARGGAGATSVAAGLATALAREPGSPVVVLDADPAGAGIDLLCGLEEAVGIRWADLVGIRATVPESALRGRLPHKDGTDWLATAPGTANAASWQPVLESLTAAYSGVVVDLPRYRVTATPPPAAAGCVLVTTLELASLANARLLGESGRLGPDPVVAVRPVGGPVRMAAAEQMLADFRLVEIPDSRALRGAADFGDLPAAAARGSFARACRTLLRELRP